MNIKNMTKIALMAAVICVIAPFSIPIGAVPISFTNFILYLSVYILGTKRTVASYIIYLILGTVGLPVFSGWAGGIGKLLGPTGGYLAGFIFMIIICGVFIEVFKNKKILHFAGMVLGTAIAYAFGTLWCSYSMDLSLTECFFMCVAPFIVGDLIKIFVAIYAGTEIKRRTDKIFGEL